MSTTADYYYHLYEASEAAKAVDDFDLVSTDASSVAEFKQILRENEIAQQKLVAFIANNPKITF